MAIIWLNITSDVKYNLKWFFNMNRQCLCCGRRKELEYMYLFTLDIYRYIQQTKTKTFPAKFWVNYTTLLVQGIANWRKFCLSNHKLTNRPNYNWHGNNIKANKPFKIMDILICLEYIKSLWIYMIVKNYISTFPTGSWREDYGYQ